MTPPPSPKEIDFQGVNVKVSYLQLKKKTRNAYFWLFLDNIITDKEETTPNPCSDQLSGSWIPRLWWQISGDIFYFYWAKKGVIFGFL